MPYIWTDPDIFLSHKGVDVYFIYMDDCANNLCEASHKLDYA